MSLNNLGIRLSDLGRREEALQATQEAAKLYRLLAQQRPDAFRPDLAMSLGNLSNRLHDAGQADEALAAAQEGVRLLAPFFLHYPRAFENLMRFLLSAYHWCCNEAEHEPDPELLGPIEEVLASLAEEQS
jgi:tetratricopeptide (TPR) repeat protein